MENLPWIFLGFEEDWGEAKFEAIAAASVWIWPGWKRKTRVWQDCWELHFKKARHKKQLKKTDHRGRIKKLKIDGMWFLQTAESGFWSSKILLYFQRSRKRRNASAVKAALPQEKQVGRFENCETKKMWLPNFFICGIWFPGRLALMAGAASWQALETASFCLSY